MSSSAATVSTTLDVTNGLVSFSKGKVIRQRWEILEKLGSGGCGSVYMVKDLKRKGYKAALKVEQRKEDDHGVLKIEVSTLARMKHCKNVVRLVDSGYRPKYNYMVMTLCGYDLMTLKNRTKEGFCENTLVRIGIHALYAIKVVHEMGYVHRDVKPGNMMNGAVGREKRMFFLIDYGMTRSFVNVATKKSIRAPRKEILLRGTLRYCSLNVHERKEQGRVDDLWAMLYMLVELYIGLPWHKKDESDVARQKRTITDKELFLECPPEFSEMAAYLRTLTYSSRPDYYRIYEWFMAVMTRESYSFADKYDWEDEKQPEPDVQTAVKYHEQEKATKRPLSPLEAEFLQYPCAAPKFFKEKILDL